MRNPRALRVRASAPRPAMLCGMVCPLVRRLRRMRRLSGCVLLLGLCAGSGRDWGEGHGRSPSLHDGPDPKCHWIFHSRRLAGGVLKARLGPDAVLQGRPSVVADEHGESLLFRGVDCAVVGEGLRDVRRHLPDKLLTVSAWVDVQTRQRWGGIVSAVQDNGDAERGWVLGYDEQSFTFGLATTGADDGDGALTYLAARSRYELGKLYHVVATYDGAVMRLYVNGVLQGESREQSGDILYPADGVLSLASYRDDNEDHRHHGRLREVAVYDVAAKPEWVTHEFESHAALSAAPPYVWVDPDFELVVAPYLQYVTQTGITVLWETTRPATGAVHYGTTAACERRAASAANGNLHEVRLEGLEPQTGYFYRIECVDSEERVIETEVSTFQTAVHEETPFAFAVISDTQGNLEVARKIAGHAFDQRPNFVLHAGDLVDTGTDKSHWTRTFFPSMQALVSRVAFFPVLGNHEQNARHYFDYIAVPDPEFYYSFRYGNAEFFMLDSNVNVGPGSEQYAWLEAGLRAARAADRAWVFVCYHHPAYSSDENDYGDMWIGKSTHGDTRMRALVPLYDRYGVDVVWNGHIHSYERTWPLRGGEVAEDGTIFMITGGGGGSLETPGPIRPWFQNTVRRGHHYCTVAIRGDELELKAFDVENRLYDTLRLVKR